MTNVPNDIREMWSDVYILFDTHYLMPNTTEAWSEYWERCAELHVKWCNNSETIITMMSMVSELLENVVKGRQNAGEVKQNGNQRVASE